MREWKPIPRLKLESIILDAELDCPAGEWTADHVYRLAREVEQARAELKELRHACLAAIGFLAGVSAVNREVVERTLAEAVRAYATGQRRET